MCKCEKCVYYYEATDFCMKTMYSAKPNATCKDYGVYPKTMPVKYMKFSNELTDLLHKDATIEDLMQMVNKINKEMI